ncbi:MAG TPA: hypothetical protein VGR31_15700 [Planctomycetota bacterium]|jgi:hypothetical protein|nr:hypothetical protein [Planctomycetota bacterium]
MTQETLLHNRWTALGAGVVLGALLLALVPGAFARQTGGDGQTPPPPEPHPLIPAFGTADSNGSMIAVTGIDVTGSSILYLVDTKGRHLAVYQANGGSDSNQGLKLVGARRIDLDLELEGYNDKSEYPVQELQKKFADIGRAPHTSK